MLDTKVTTRVPKAKDSVRSGAATPPGRSLLRRDLAEDFAPRRASGPAGSVVNPDEDFVPIRRGLRLRLGTGIPRSVIGRVLAGAGLLLAAAAALAGLWGLWAMLLTNPRLVLAASSDIQITGNNHLTRAQLLTVFGEDVDRNILAAPLEVRRAELERLPWVEHATVMRLLPNRFRVAILERRPVAFVRQGNSIGLVDAHGVLLDMASDGDDPAPSNYSFPVLTGILGSDPLSVRAARMKLFAKFTGDLGGHAGSLSEIDLSNPEDIKALIPGGGSDILVHFGQGDFLRRYELFEKNLPGWKSQYPKLASADMRYERQVVLEMQPNTAVPVNEAADGSAAAAPVAPKKPAVATHAKAAPAARAPNRDLARDKMVKARPKPTQAVPQ